MHTLGKRSRLRDSSRSRLQAEEPPMDLNSQYFRHQRTMMRAAATGCAGPRRNLLGAAAEIAGSIAGHQHGLGAAAAAGWRLVA